MIPVNARRRQVPCWQRELAQAIRDPAELLQELALDSALLPIVWPTQFPLRVPRGFVAKMRKGDPDDPLLRQVWPLAAELIPVPGFVTDPVGDQAAQAVPGVLHKYQGRALLIVTGACAVHCRYCFRREFPYAEAQSDLRDWRSALDYLAGDTSIREVILSGGDPLSLSNQRLGTLLAGLQRIPHLVRLRIHSRLPIVLPERVDEGLLALLASTRLQPILVVHANHPREIDAAVRTALQRFRAIGVTLLNQSVLLRGVNDEVERLAELSEALFTAGVLPYYLHLLDRVRGAAHYEVNETEASVIMKALRERLPGYLLPRLVREQPGQLAKTPVWE
ncbi:putative aminomutase [Candidatus Competibacter denitrificans Run_A_D11]|uniref:L-lysine 2,3-aminomutase n=1 Tax=Candidatus Competibacter denitrificans Run_A_D11 TaxID=1400863 RepID=W6M4R3_9GAMM|nr:EF-P beta-lysylation protein EpmB [Candidatus Competibacter denitrificans]CDI02702.1 putative aminomutase [Candidatus Competibacter denitrificans Run_A_D11]HAS86328.1 EF-P beta-lysylation protein EpmB [Candidatus Competibacteraceae bacterium]HRC70248.1 EF-P beta-lysylation protein EpmB [Candidatus Competibacter denitrificans]